MEIVMNELNETNELNIEVIEKVVEEPELLFTRPELLLHPNLPKPMHNLAPRTLMKAREWNEIRREAYARNNYHCWACGVYVAFDLNLNKFVNDENTTLDAHESYNINYDTKTVELVEIVALCKNCHNYVHSGRLSSMFEKGEKDEEDCFIVYTHGDSVLIDAGLIPINVVDGKTYQDEWGEWKLIFRGQEYRSKFKDYWDWYKHYMIG